MSNPVTAGWGYVAGGYGAIGALLAGYVVSVLRRRRSLARRLRSGAAGLGVAGDPAAGPPPAPGLRRDGEPATAATEEVS